MSRAAAKPVRLSVLSTPAHLAVVRAAVEAVCRIVGFDEERTTHVVLSVGEAMANIIRHAYGGANDGLIEVELTPLKGEGGPGLRVCLRDSSRKASPAAGAPAARSPRLRPGGLGVPIMKRCMDSIDYRKAEGGGTVLTMTKRQRRRGR
jgi:anti-sigma regulatory factor (Ser/Thr protein kinase)